jgi:hypothetical protein
MSADVSGKTLREFTRTRKCHLKQRHLENLFVVPKGILPEEFPRDAVVFPEPEDLHESQRWLLVGAAVA